MELSLPFSFSSPYPLPVFDHLCVCAGVNHPSTWKPCWQCNLSCACIHTREHCKQAGRCSSLQKRPCMSLLQKRACLFIVCDRANFSSVLSYRILSAWFFCVSVTCNHAVLYLQYPSVLSTYTIANISLCFNTNAVTWVCLTWTSQFSDASTMCILRVLISKQDLNLDKINLDLLTTVVNNYDFIG